jgi:hypothetical protein
VLHQIVAVAWKPASQLLAFETSWDTGSHYVNLAFILGLKPHNNKLYILRHCRTNCKQISRVDLKLTNAGHLWDLCLCQFIFCCLYIVLWTTVFLLLFLYCSLYCPSFNLRLLKLFLQVPYPQCVASNRGCRVKARITTPRFRDQLRYRFTLREPRLYLRFKAS